MALKNTLVIAGSFLVIVALGSIAFFGNKTPRTETPAACPEIIIPDCINGKVVSGKDGRGCDTAICQPDVPAPNACAEEGETVSGAMNAQPIEKKCCASLTAATIFEIKDGQCNAAGGALVCIKCGDGTCGASENNCNCPMDCPEIISNNCTYVNESCCQNGKCVPRSMVKCATQPGCDANCQPKCASANECGNDSDCPKISQPPADYRECDGAKICQVGGGSACVNRSCVASKRFYNCAECPKGCLDGKCI